MRRVFIGICGVMATTGCTGFDLARLAPPGIVRYERIAEEKEPNPAIVARLDERGEEHKPRFPKLGETAAGGARLRPIPNGRVTGEISRLAAERENLDMALETDRLESDAAAMETDSINEAAAELSAAVDDAKSAAARDRAENLAIETENEK